MAVSLLAALQGGIESLYRIDTQLDVQDFLVDEEGRDAFSPARAPKEQLLLRQSSGELELALFFDESTLANLRAADPRRRLDESNLNDFLLAIEGVSHFVYVAHRARQDRPVSAVELELQAEVDKYLVSLLVAWDQAGVPPEGLRERLFARVQFHDDLTEEERDRYHLANHAADEYTRGLERRFVESQNVPDMLSEARQFYRKGLAEKLDHITAKAA